MAPAPNQKSAKGQAPRTGAFRSADTVVVKPSKKQITGEWGGTGILGQENAIWPPIWVTATFKSDGTVIDHVSKNKFVGKWEIKENFLLVRYSYNVQPGVVMRSVAQLQLSRFSYMA